ncbi:MAG TPA: DNA mismatch repair protein MutS [Cytophagaceae bacterium]|jgi:DNA mismatch repair protein MutS|nr:DNA mismatch repair protein MutS [Cytophagaceae bacterium]
MAHEKETPETPLMKQYWAIKAKYPGALLLFRVGDFYETFSEDAVKASKILGITLTKRGAGSASETELAGFPHHSLDNYLPRLVRAGQRVAICDQLEDPKGVKGIVKRGVTELVTPGVSYNDNVLEGKSSNYLASVHFGKDNVGISLLDISTGDLQLAQGSWSYIERILQSFQPSEIIYCKNKKKEFSESIGDRFPVYPLEEWVYQYDFAYEKLTSHFNTVSLKGFGIEGQEEGIVAAGAVFYYLNATEHHHLKHINTISRIEEEKFVWLDRFTIRNLEIISSQYAEGICLLDIMDQTVTPMGGRLMKKWLVMPLKEVDTIQERLDVVQALHDKPEKLEQLLHHLRQIGDLERLISKVSAGRINPREMNQLKRSLEQLAPIAILLKETGVTALARMAEQINVCELLVQKIEAELKPDAPMLSNQGKLVKEGVDAKLDELRSIAYSGKDHLLQIQQREVERTGIGSLKISFNKVFGYYLEVTHTHKDKVPGDWIRKQTLVNAERYITEELKVYEETILTAEDKIITIESDIFRKMILFAEDYVQIIQQNAQLIARLDCLVSFAYISVHNNYTRPQVNDSLTLNIVEGRHPVIEKNLPPGEDYIPNDVMLDDQSCQIIVITGPNMAGKSALLRQTALIVLMAQVGCFVPAKSAEIGIVDKIFTRVGASDNLSRGESTFMVEMSETASILNNLSERSIILMDEIGRGTSTYDGISIAWSIVEFLHQHPKYRPKTLFATHYHELNQLSEQFNRIKNFNVSVKEAGNKIVFLRKLKEGGSEHSFGIHVAQLAGMPNQVVLRSAEVLKNLEKEKLTDAKKKNLKEVSEQRMQMQLFEPAPAEWEELKGLFEGLDINTMSPVEALLKLNEMKNLVQKDKIRT